MDDNLRILKLEAEVEKLRYRQIKTLGCIVRVHGALVALSGLDQASNVALREPIETLYDDAMGLLELLKEDSE